VPKPDAGVGGLLWGFLFFEQFPTVIALQLLLYGSFLFRPEPAFRCVAYLALVLALYFLVLSTTTLMVPKTKYTRALDRIEENHDPIGRHISNYNAARQHVLFICFVYFAIKGHIELPT
jgi:hypothetical protein